MKKIIKLILLKGLDYVLIGIDVIPFYLSKLLNKIADKVREAIRKIKRDM
jgi:hypothetical protein